jgi:hypothetical protein
MKVGCNGAIQVAVSFASVRQYCGLTIEDCGKNAKAILGIEGAAVNVQTGICVCDVEMYTLARWCDFFHHLPGNLWKKTNDELHNGS